MFADIIGIKYVQPIRVSWALKEEEKEEEGGGRRKSNKKGTDLEKLAEVTCGGKIPMHIKED